MFKKYIKIPFTEFCAYGSNLTCTKPTKDRKYIQTLTHCKTYASLKDIYPGVDKPLTHEIHKLWKLGYVNKYTQQQYISSTGNLTRVWYKITRKGKALLRKAK